MHLQSERHLNNYSNETIKPNKVVRLCEKCNVKIYPATGIDI